MLSLLALGYRFQIRLIGQVAEAHADRPDEQMETVRPPLVAAIAGRLAPLAEEWLGIDPNQVVVSLHRGPGWGSVELTGRGEQRRLRASLPAGWLARVWAAGLALTGATPGRRGGPGGLARRRPLQPVRRVLHGERWRALRPGRCGAPWYFTRADPL